MTQAPWLEAIRAKELALQSIEAVLKAAEFGVPADLPFSQILRWRDSRKSALELAPMYRRDVSLLKHADAYAWMDPAREAVLRAAQSVPLDAALTMDQIPGSGVGWWHFQPPLPYYTSVGNNPTVAMTFGMMAHPDRFVKTGEELAWDETRAWTHLVNISGYVRSPDGAIVPSTQFQWRIGETLGEVIHRVHSEYEWAYGPKGPFADATRRGATTGLDHTLASVVLLARFFQAACVWLHQDILVSDTPRVPSNMPRQQRRQLERSMPSKLRVIALRHTHHVKSDIVDVTPRTTSPREYDYQWVVSGHWRNQPFGPARLGRKLIYINPYVKGPDDKPLKPQADKLYVVVK